MKKLLIITTICFILYNTSHAQVIINRHTESKISAKGISGKSDLVKEVIIPEIDVKKVISEWERESTPFKFAEPVLVDISPFQQGLWEKINDYSINRIKITAKNANSIAIYFDKLQLSKNAELYIYNVGGTVITGPITEKENISGDKLWGSNVFQGSTLILEFKAPINEEKLNELHIKKILYGIKSETKRQDKDSTNGPGFGLSSPCNVNVACPAGNGWEQERRAIAQTVDEGGRWGSAALINNTCNILRPFILTANHNIFQSGQLVNTNNTTFEFLWFSPTCIPTTNTTSTIFFNGATIRARWDQTDFALLELNQNIPQNSNLTFLGWSRSSSPSLGSVGIHHPSGDIMKIAIENDLATIGNIRTFANTAWRVQWDSGTVEPGSSGSPLFNMNRQVVGQLFSNTQPTQPPCNQPIGGTNYGRFDNSWTGGGTNATRLSNWLDSTNTGSLTTNTTNISALINPSITGNDILCSTGIYQLNITSPAGAMVNWTATPGGIVTLTPSGNSVTLTRLSNGTITLTANFNYCLQSYTLNKIIRVGGYSSSDYPISGPSTACTNENVYFNTNDLPGATNYQWTWSSSWTYVSGQGTRYLALHTGTTTGGGYVTVRVANACDAGGSPDVKIVQVNNCGFSFTAFPNPSTGNVNIAIIQQQGIASTGTNQSKIYQIKVFDQSGNIKKQYSYPVGVTNTNISLSGLRAGIYIIQVYDGSSWSNQQIVKQ